MDRLLDLLDLSGLTPLGRGLLVLAIVEGAVIVHLWRTLIRERQRASEAADRAWMELRKLTSEILYAIAKRES